MKPPKEIIEKIRNGISYLVKKPYYAIPGYVIDPLHSILSGGEISPEQARDIIEWYEKETFIPKEILLMIVGKQKGLSWFTAYAKKAVPKPIVQPKEEKPAAAPQRSLIAVSSGSPGDSGWSPLIAAVSESGGVYLRVVNWIGGTGIKPPSGSFIGPSGFVENVEDATNIRGPSGGGSGGEGVPVFIQDDAPITDSEKYLWIQTGLPDDGFTFWIEEGN